MSASLVPCAAPTMAAVPSFGNIDISKVLTSEGPVVTAVLLKAGPDAAVEQVQVDTTPQKQMVQTLLGGPFTFLGQYEEEGIVLMCLRDQGNDAKNASTTNAAVAADPNLNQHKLQPPFDHTQVRGDILLVKVVAEEEEKSDAADGTPVDTLAAKSNEEFFLNYTKDEYIRFAARTDVEPPKAVVSEDLEEEDEDEEEMESDEEEEESDEEGMESTSDDENEEEGGEDDAGGFMDLLMGQVIQRFHQEHKRLPDETELQALQSAIAQRMEGMN